VRGGVKLMKKKLVITCMAVGLSLALATPSFAAMTLNLDPGVLADGTYSSGSPGIISTVFGNVEFVGQIRNAGDVDFPSIKVFDVDDSSRTASLTFNFDTKYEVRDVTFIYGGNKDVITVEALDSSDTVLDSLVNAPTDNGDDIGPVTLNAGFGNSIFKLSWQDPGTPGDLIRYDLAELGNVSLSVIPAPGAILLGSIGVGIVGWLRRKRTL
jgi:hypothetical protein